MTSDPQLKFFAAAPTDPNVAWLERVLLEERRWLTAAELVQRSGGVLHDRAVRVLANASANVLSGPGSPGYRHLATATPEEIDHWANALIAQGRLMIQRAVRLRRRAHERIG